MVAARYTARSGLNEVAITRCCAPEFCRQFEDALIQILIAQKHSLWRGALAAVLSKEEDLHVVAEVGHPDEVLQAADQERPDLSVLDVPLPGGMEIGTLCHSLCQSLPRSKIMLVLERWTFQETGAAVARLVPRVGLIAKDVPPGRLIEDVRRLVRGEPVLDAQLAVAALATGENPLTDREREVLRCVIQGAPVKDIAAELFLSAGTVRNYLARAVAKTRARTRIEAIRIAQNAGWI
jgi:two-component system, NarL family, response regulator DesR